MDNQSSALPLGVIAESFDEQRQVFESPRALGLTFAKKVTNGAHTGYIPPCADPPIGWMTVPEQPEQG